MSLTSALYQRRHISDIQGLYTGFGKAAFRQSESVLGFVLRFWALASGFSAESFQELLHAAVFIDRETPPQGLI